MDSVKDLMPQKHYENLLELEDKYWWHQGKFYAISEFLRPYIKNNSIRLADVGCGTGGFLNYAKRELKLNNIIGLDCSQAALDAIKGRGLTGWSVDFDKDFFSKDGGYDIITVLDVLEHIDDEKNFLKNIHDNLLPDGIIAINVPAFAFLFSSWDKIHGHKRRYSSGQLKNILEENNFKVLKISYIFSYLFPVACLRRILRLNYTDQNCVFPKVSDWVNKALLRISELETRLAKVIKIPFGSSVLCVARKI